MPAAADAITSTLPRLVLPDVVSLSASPLEGMHELLKHTTAPSPPSSGRNWKTLVQMAHFGQIIPISLRLQRRPINLRWIEAG